jgi:ribosomal protein S18 acetylase RimI-like enzyme
MSSFEIREIEEQDRDWVESFTRDHWGAPIVVAHGTVFHPRQLPGFIACEDGERVGLVTYHVDGGDCEIVTLNSIRERRGIASALVEKVKRSAMEPGCSRLWLVTTNDNLTALRFYQRRGFHMVRVHPDAVNESRRLKPEIGRTGEYGIPIRDEIELEMILTRRR